MYKKVNPKQSFPKLEEEVLEFWNKEEIFEESMNRPDAEEFNFYDGPPFATGTPHYGHILAGTIKDVIPRYQTMLGKKVSRKFGWDTHGLPIENIVEKKMWISGKDDIEKIWVHAFNEECRANVFGYVDEWKKTVNRMWRWVDMEDDYKTMDTNFMESVWWVFKSIHDKGLVYEGNRVVPYCPRCTTPLSNFEVNQGYKDKQDKTVTVKFKVEGNESKYILAWTTTPWTLPANLWLAVWADIMYAEILDKETNETYIIASDLVWNYYKNEEDYTLVKEYTWTCLAWIKYEALFDDAKIQLQDMWADLWTGVEMWENSYSIVIGHHVTTESGTGIVHIAPAYWEDDNIIGKEQKLGFFSHIWDTGKTYNLLENNGVDISDFNEIVLKDMKDRNLAVLINTINHSYPHCWRCDTPLIYRAISAWYVAVEKIRDKMVANNLKTNWTPENIKEGRFGKWLEWARDWNISRNRYWGSAMPVWQSEDKKSEVVIGSIEELYQANKEYGQITKIIVVRHGQTDYNLEQRHDHEWKAQLTDLGKQYAEKIWEYLEDEGCDYIYSSPLERCINTITPLSKNSKIEILTDERITENRFDQMQDKKWSDISEEEANDMHALDGKVYEGAERMTAVKERISNFIADITKKHPGKTVVVCSHGWPVHHIESVISWENHTKKKFALKKNDVFDRKEIITTKYINSSTGEELDIHKHFVDEIFVKCPKTGEKLTRIPEVLDCWFESGSMPYASKHYMGAVEGEEFKFPADFIAEGLDQTRGWFYTLIILSTALFDSPATMNTIVNGIILAEDGKKMSKSLNNYPAPELIFDKYGADAMRFYLMNSPVVEWQDMRFTEQGVEEVVKKVILPLWNTYSFFVTYANIDGFESDTEGLGVCSNPLDRWILSETQKLTLEIREWLDGYRINDATKNIPAFMDNLTNWYIRRSRKRFWKSENDGDKVEAYRTLHEVLVSVSKLIAPFMPFVAENIYQNLTGKKSVHLELMPKAQVELIDNELSADMDKTKKIINLGLAWRVNHKLKVRQPLKSVTIWENLSDYYKNILMEELNVKEVIVVDGNTLAKQICKPNWRAIGPKFGKNVKDIMSAAKSWNFEELDNGSVQVWEFTLEAWDFELVFEAWDSAYEIEAGFGMVIAMDSELTEELKQEWIARDLVRAIQDARKEAEFNVEDRIHISISWDNISDVLEIFGKYIETETLSTISNNLDTSDLEKEVEIGELKVVIQLKK